MNKVNKVMLAKSVLMASMLTAGAAVIYQESYYHQSQTVYTRTIASNEVMAKEIEKSGNIEVTTLGATEEVQLITGDAPEVAENITAEQPEVIEVVDSEQPEVIEVVDAEQPEVVDAEQPEVVDAEQPEVIDAEQAEVIAVVDASSLEVAAILNPVEMSKEEKLAYCREKYPNPTDDVVDQVASIEQIANQSENDKLEVVLEADPETDEEEVVADSDTEKDEEEEVVAASDADKDDKDEDKDEDDSLSKKQIREILAEIAAEDKKAKEEEGGKAPEGMAELFLQFQLSMRAQGSESFMLESLLGNFGGQTQRPAQQDPMQSFLYYNAMNNMFGSAGTSQRDFDLRKFEMEHELKVLDRKYEYNLDRDYDRFRFSPASFASPSLKGRYPSASEGWSFI